MNIHNVVEKLDQKELRELNNHIKELLHPAVVYVQKPSKCGCKNCREGGSGHGNYWYGYFSYKGKTHCVYVGKDKIDIDASIIIKKRGL